MEVRSDCLYALTAYDLHREVAAVDGQLERNKLPSSLAIYRDCLKKFLYLSKQARESSDLLRRKASASASDPIPR